MTTCMIHGQWTDAECRLCRGEVSSGCPYDGIVLPTEDLAERRIASAQWRMWALLAEYSDDLVHSGEPWWCKCVRCSTDRIVRAKISTELCETTMGLTALADRWEKRVALPD